MRDNDFSVSPPLITRRRLLALGAGVGALGLGWPRSAPAAVRVEITSGDVQPMPIALPDFVGGASGDSEAARGVTQVVTNDLKRSGLFAPIDPAAYIKRLAIMDQDGANVGYITRGDDLVLTPRFSTNDQVITYMSYGQGDPKVYLYNTKTRQREVVGNFPGMSFSPRFSPTGDLVIMSL